jgi:hypothetical protein
VLSLADSTAELTRWAALIASSKSTESAADDRLSLEHMKLAEGDSSSFIRAEATYLAATVERRLRRQAISKKERKATKAGDREDKLRTELLRPELAFQALELRFQQRSGDYTVREALDYLDAHRH